MNAIDRITGSILRIRCQLPFFGALALFAEHGLDESISTAATNGRKISFNSDFAASLSNAELDAVMVHELLHAALLHCVRRQGRDPFLWNVAADIVVNGMIREESGLHLPSGACIDPRIEEYPVEEVYEIIVSSATVRRLEWIGEDIIEAKSGAVFAGLTGETRHIGVCCNDQLEEYWRRAWQQASMLTERLETCRNHVAQPRRFERMVSTELDWRILLRRFLVRTAVDFSGFDRRLIGRGLYIETLEGETVSVRIAVDTSSSVSESTVGIFMSEIREMTRMYPHLDAQLFYADTDVWGPFSLDCPDVESPKGGGGTSFRPFFNVLAMDTELPPSALIVYLTDGYGLFPIAPPLQSVLWVVPAGGLPTAKFPFGEVARILKTG
jgi:predicted metal-dependent peptidase